MAKAVRIHEFGGPEKLQLEEVDVGAPGEGQVRLEHKAISVNFADLMIREGKYNFTPDLPATMGLEGAGEVTEVGPGVAGWKPGDRAVYTFALGSYSTERLAPAANLVHVPDGVSDIDAAAGFLRGMTAQYLVRQTHPVSERDIVLVHAAAGGMGELLAQWCKHLGATVIGTVGSDEKARAARASGCDHVINYSTGDFAEQVLALTGGKGATVVYDSVGQAVYEGNIKALAVLGRLVNYGHTSGLLKPLDVMQLNAKSLHFTKCSLRDYVAQPDGIQIMSGEAFGLIAAGVLKLKPQLYPLADVAQAHRDMAARKTTGQVVLEP